MELLLDHGARIDLKDRSKLTTLYITVTREHTDVVNLLLERSANIKSKARYSDTPLIRAIQVSSMYLIKLILERGARVDKLPSPPGVASLKDLKAPLIERAKELLKLEE